MKTSVIGESFPFDAIQLHFIVFRPIHKSGTNDPLSIHVEYTHKETFFA
jgi:hypothetical protein